MIVVRMKKESSDVNSGIEGTPPPFGVITVVFRGWGKYTPPYTNVRYVTTLHE